jgi:sugar/nucleoside kinase (ribokinase family)
VVSSFDVIGVGANSVDYVYRLPVYPSPDGPEAKVQIADHLISYGGQTATTLCTCAALGLRAKYIGVFGSDAGGRGIRDELERRGVDLADAVTRDVPNGFAVILLDDRKGERVVLWSRAPGLELGDALPANIFSTARLLHVDDTDYDAAIRASALARAAGLPITSDIERVTDRTAELVAAVTIPIFAGGVPEDLTGEADTERALRTLRREHDGLLCVTLGSRGAMLLDGDTLYHEPARKVDVVDTTGAGDVFRGAFIHALLRGDHPGDILRFAVVAATISCTRIGAIGAVLGT